MLRTVRLAGEAIKCAPLAAADGTSSFFLLLRAQDWRLDLRAPDDADRDAWIVAITRNAHASFDSGWGSPARRGSGWRAALDLVTLNRGPSSDHLMDEGPEELPL